MTTGMLPPSAPSSTGRRLWLTATVMVYTAVAGLQLGLPGLHYDEAKEAGVNAMELLSGLPVTAFRNATISLFGRGLPLMVQDYIGALNVYLALPLLEFSGIGVPNLRTLSVLCGLFALLALERAVSEWVALAESNGDPANRETRRAHAPIAPAGLLAVTLLALSPSFVFWSRQGIFVTNITEPLVYGSLWQGLRWLRTSRSNALLLSAFAGGLSIYAKLLAGWFVGPFVLLAGLWWLRRHRRQEHPVATLSAPLVLAAAAAFGLPLTPLLLFNLQTGGTITSILGNLDQSYYGVANHDLVGNLAVRLQQLAQSLRGDQFWYLGGVFGNRFAPWLAAGAAVFGLWRQPRLLVGPLCLLAGSLLLSLFTVSDLFVTHFALVQPVAVAVAGLGLSTLTARARPPLQLVGKLTMVAVVAAWVLIDLSATVGYHRTLSRSGGLGDHSDAGYQLAYYLRTNGLGAPVALDWGFDAPVRFLTAGHVRPIEIFGYTALDAPDQDFGARLDLFLSNPETVYLLHPPDHTIFAGRREAWLAQAETNGLQPIPEMLFRQRDGTVVYELWRIAPPTP